MEYIYILFSFMFGTIIGSFLNVVVWRLPQGETLIGRSQCPSCKRTLGPLELVPILSFLVQKGRCLGCRTHIFFRYMLIEILTGLLFAGAWVCIGPTDLVGFLELARVWFGISVFVCVFIIDLEHYLILDKVIFPATGILLVFNLALGIVQGSLTNFDGILISGIIAALAAFFVFFCLWAISFGKWLGFGDVKLMIVMGLFLGWPVVWVAVLLAFYLGASVSIVLLALKKKGLKSMVPFGTFLTIATLLAYIWGKPLVLWYVHLLGLA